MQTPALTLKIEMFGNMIEELNYWHSCCGDINYGEDSLEYTESRFIEMLDAVREMREILLEDLKEYRHHCKIEDIPVDLGYCRIERQLKESTFSLIGE